MDENNQVFWKFVVFRSYPTFLHMLDSLYFDVYLQTYPENQID